MKAILALIILLLSYVIRVFVGLNYKTYETNKIPILRSATSQFIAMMAWISLLLWASHLFYDVAPIALLIGLLLYFFVFNFFFLKRFIRYFGGDLVFPDSLKHCKGIIEVMVSSYVLRKKMFNNNEKESLLLTLKSRYPFMKSRKRTKILEKCDDIKELIYEVLKIELIDFDVRKSNPTKKHVDEIIDKTLSKK